MFTSRHATRRAVGGFAMLALIGMLAYACGGSGYSTGPDNGNGNGNGNGTSGNTTSIDMVGTAFTPATDTVAVGATVTWTNQSNFAHTVSANDGSFDSGQLTNGQTFQHTYDAIGSYPYYCKNHGSPTTGMRGVIIVK